MSEESKDTAIVPVKKPRRQKIQLPEFNPLPWERQKGESGKAYEAFVIYRDLKPADRNLIAVSKTLHKSLPLLYKWKSTWEWDNRVLRFDAYVQQNAIADYQRKVREMNARHVMIAYGFEVKVAQALENYPIEKLIDNPAEMLRWFQVASDLERKAMNQPTEIVRQEQLNVNVNLNKASENCESMDEKEARLKRILRTLKEVGALEEQERIIEGTVREVPTESGTDSSGANDDSKADEVHSDNSNGQANSVPPS